MTTAEDVVMLHLVRTLPRSSALDEECLGLDAKGTGLIFGGLVRIAETLVVVDGRIGRAVVWLFLTQTRGYC